MKILQILSRFIQAVLFKITKMVLPSGSTYKVPHIANKNK